MWVAKGQNVGEAPPFIHSSIDNLVDNPVGKGDKSAILRNIKRLA